MTMPNVGDKFVFPLNSFRPTTIVGVSLQKGFIYTVTAGALASRAFKKMIRLGLAQAPKPTITSASSVADVTATIAGNTEATVPNGTTVRIRKANTLVPKYTGTTTSGAWSIGTLGAAFDGGDTLDVQVLAFNGFVDSAVVPLYVHHDAPTVDATAHGTAATTGTSNSKDGTVITVYKQALGSGPYVQVATGVVSGGSGVWTSDSITTVATDKLKATAGLGVFVSLLSSAVTVS